MTLTTAFRELHQQMEDLHQLTIELQLVVGEDKPLHDELQPVRQIDDATVSMQGYLEQALVATNEGWRAVNELDDLETARRSLIACQGQYESFLDIFIPQLTSYEPLTELDRIGRARKGEWRAWTGVVLNMLDRSQVGVKQVNKALIHCWQELAERAGTTGVSVRATNIGQQFKLPEGKFDNAGEFT